MKTLPGTAHTFSATLDLPGPLPAEVVTVAALGILFLQEVEGVLNPLQEGRGMRIVEVG